MVDVDFAADLRDGNETLVAVVLPRLGGDAEDFSDFVGLKPVFAGTSKPGFLDYFNEKISVILIDKIDNDFHNCVLFPAAAFGYH